MKINLKNISILLIIFALLISIFQVILINNYIYNASISIILYITFSINLVLFITLSALSIKNNQQIEIERLNFKTLSILYDSMRAFKHDYANIIQGIGGYIALNDMNGLKNFYKDLCGEFSQINNLSSLSPNVINNPSIYKTLCNKYYLACNKNINIQFDILSDFSKLNIKTFDLNRILGILLDNSIEAAKDSNDKIIKLSVLNYPNNKIIKLENTYHDKNIDLNKIFEKSYSTKKNNSGIGLWEIKQILKKYDGLKLNTYMKENLFIQELQICG